MTVRRNFRPILVLALVDTLGLGLLALERAGDEFHDIAFGDPLDVRLGAEEVFDFGDRGFAGNEISGVEDLVEQWSYTLPIR